VPCEITWKKFCGAGQGTGENMAHSHCMLDTSDRKRTLRILIAFPLQQWNQECAFMVRYNYIVSHIFIFLSYTCLL